MNHITIFRAHLPAHVAYAKQFVARGKKIIIHTHRVTPDVAELTKNPLVQARFGIPENLTHMADLIIA